MNLPTKSNNTNVELSVVVPYRHGSKLRQRALRYLMDSIKAQTFKNFELIVVEEVIGTKGIPLQWAAMKKGITENLKSSYDIHLWERVSKLIEQKYVGSLFKGKFEYVSEVDKYFLLEDPRPFNKSWCINVGIRNSISDNILVIDADSLFGKDYFKKVKDFSVSNPKYFSGYNTLLCLPGEHNPVTRILNHYDIKASGGAWYTNKDFFFNTTGGMNENYFGYGAEDNDTWNRARHFLGEIAQLNYPFIHQYHDWPVPPGRGSMEDDNSFPDKNWYIKNCKLLKKTTGNLNGTIEKLKVANLGNFISPTEVNL